MVKDNCLFCQIVKGKVSCDKVYEDQDFLGFLDINPFNPGHSMIIPKKHYDWVWQVNKVEKYWGVANKVALATMEALKQKKPITVLFITSGFEVPHAHIHIVPRFKNDGHGGFIKLNNKKKVSSEQMKQIAGKIFKQTNKIKKGGADK